MGGWADPKQALIVGVFFLLLFTLVTGPRRSLILKPSDTRVYEAMVVGVGGRKSQSAAK